MKKIILLPVLLLICGQLFSQNTPERCGIEAYYDFLERDYLNIKKTVDAEHQKALEAIRQPSFRSSGEVYTIPVVVHIVYENSDENISDSQVLSQIEVLNTDYRKMNPDASMVPSLFANLVTDGEIEFCLATVDPDGNSTTGITRTTTDVNEFDNNNRVKSDTDGKPPWAADRYLNIWVCDLRPGLLGFATKPGTSLSIDGVVVDYEHFGTEGTAKFPYNRGRTSTHEVGHYLGLKHLWGNGGCGANNDCPDNSDDDISDTPCQENEHGGCPVFGSSSTISCGSQDMFMNYMDYVHDACMYMFTTEQVSLMRFHLNNQRASLLQSTPVACDPTGGEGCNKLATSLQMGFEDNENFDKWTIVNANDDSKSWSISEGLGQESGARTGSACMAYTWSISNDADDWFFTPCVEVRGDKQYKLHFWYATGNDFSSTNYVEKMKVGFADSPSPDALLDNTIDFGEVLQPYNSNTTNNNYKEVVVDIPNFGTKDIYVGFQCYSEPDQHSLLIDDIEIEMLVGTNEVISNDAFDIYPNPAKNHLLIDLDFDENIEHLQISLVDITGRTLSTKVFENYSKGSLQFDINDYPNGVYFINIQADEATITQKIIVSN